MPAITHEQGSLATIRLLTREQRTPVPDVCRGVRSRKRQSPAGISIYTTVVERTNNTGGLRTDDVVRSGQVEIEPAYVSVCKKLNGMDCRHSLSHQAAKAGYVLPKAVTEVACRGANPRPYTALHHSRPAGLTDTHFLCLAPVLLYFLHWSSEE